MSALRDSPAPPGDGRALTLVGTVVGLTTACCLILFEISNGWSSVDEGRGIVGWATTVAMLAAVLFTEYWVLLAAFRHTGLKFNIKRLEPRPPLPLLRALAVVLVAFVVMLAVVTLFHQAVPILPFRSEPMLVAVGVSLFMMEFVDLRANRAYWAEKLEQANNEGETNTQPPLDPPAGSRTDSV